MLDRIECGLDLVKVKSAIAGVIDKAVYRLDRRHADTDAWQSVADLGVDLLAGDQRDQHRLVAHQQVRLDAEGRRKPGHRRLHLFGVGAVQ